MSSRRGVPRLTRKHLARVEREQRQRRWILGGTVASLILVLSLIAYGWYDINVLRARRPVLTVNGETVSGASFKARVMLAQLDVANRAQTLQQMQIFFASDPQIKASLDQQLSQLFAQLQNPQALGQAVLDQLIDELLLRQEAERRDITISEDEVQRAIEEAFGFFPEGTPTPRPSPTANPTLMAAATATAGADPTRIASEAAATPEASPTPAPTATTYTLEAFEQDYQDYLQRLAESGGITEQDFRARFEVQLLREKVLEDMRDEVPREQPQTHFRHILVEDQETADEVLQKLQSGEGWEEVLQAYTLDEVTKDEAGDLGWFTEEKMAQQYGPTFQVVVLATEVGEYSVPVQSPQGWHVIQVLERAERPLDDADFDQAVQIQYNRLLRDLREQAEIDVSDTWVEFLPDAIDVNPAGPGAP